MTYPGGFGIFPDAVEITIWLFFLPLAFILLARLTGPIIRLAVLYQREGRDLWAFLEILLLFGCVLVGGLFLTHRSLLFWSPEYGVPSPSPEYAFFSLFPMFTLILVFLLAISSAASYLYLREKEIRPGTFLAGSLLAGGILVGIVAMCWLTIFLLYDVVVLSGAITALLLLTLLLIPLVMVGVYFGLRRRWSDLAWHYRLSVNLILIDIAIYVVYIIVQPVLAFGLSTVL